MKSVNAEAERLKVVRQCGVLGSGSGSGGSGGSGGVRESACERLCAATARLLGARCCWLGVLDARRVWVLASSGYSGPQELPRRRCTESEGGGEAEGCVCCVRSGEVLQLVDGGDSSVSGGVAVHCPCADMAVNWKYYAHTPVMVEGAVVGLLCIADSDARPPLDVDAKMNMLDFAYALSNILEQRRADLLFKSMDSQTFINSLGGSLQSSVREVQGTTSQVAAEVRKCGVSIRQALRQDCLQDISLSLSQINMMTNHQSVKVVPSDGGLDESSSLLAIVKETRDLLPMLVSDERSTWEMKPGLEEVQVHFPDVLASVLIALLFPLSRISSSLHTCVDYCIDDGSSDLPIHTDQLVEDQRVRLGNARVHIISHEEVSDSASLQQALTSRTPLSELEQSVVKSLTAMSLYQAEGGFQDVWRKHVTTLNQDSKGTESVTGDKVSTETVKVEYILTVPCKVVKELRVAIERSLSVTSPTNDEEAAQPLRVLVVDDCKMIQKVLGRFLKSQKCEVTTAENGLVGFELLKHCCEDNDTAPFDVMFMDFLMPVMDGLQALREIHSWRGENPQLAERLQRLFIIGFSATAHSQEQDDAFGEYEMPLHILYINI
jgi:CheY-like chemotaxis protein